MGWRFTRSVSASARCVVILLCLQPVVVRAKQADAEQETPEDTLTLKARLVDIDVIVKDNRGKFIPGLEAEDFTIVENGVPQRVEFFDPPTMGAATTGAPGSALDASTGSGPPRNIISLLLDQQTTEAPQVKRVGDGTVKYIRERICESDSVAVFSVSNGLRLLQPFTNDKTKLIAAVANGFRLNASSSTPERKDTAADIGAAQESLKRLGGDDATAGADARGTVDAGRAAERLIVSRTLERFQALRSQLSAQQSRPVLAALAAICEAQRGIPGKKVLVLFSEGFVTSSTQDWQVQGLVAIANRSNVSIYIIDSSGLTADAPQGGGPRPNAPLESVSGITSQESRIRANGGEDVFDNIRHEGLNRQQEILYRISGDTGGSFIKNTNDISRGLERIDQEIRARYTLGYYPTNQNFDGSFRKVKIEVHRSGADVSARRGYYALATEELDPLSPDEKKFMATFDAAAAQPAIALYTELTPFRSTDGRYVVPVSMEIPPTAVKVEQKGDVHTLHLEVLGVVREPSGKILTRLGGNFDIKLDPAQFQAVLNNNIYYRQDIELEPGTYTVDLLVRDWLSGKAAARRQQLVLPAAAARLATSGLVLSRLALPAMPQPGGAGAGDVFTTGAVQIRPTPSREFRAVDNLIIFFDVYNAATNAETGKAQVRVTVTLTRDGKAATRPVAYMLTDQTEAPVPHLTFAKFIKLDGLASGSYGVTVEALDLVTEKLVTQGATFVVKP